MIRLAGNQSTSSFASGRSRVPRVGELLTAARVITPEILDEALLIAKTSKTMIGRTLVTLGRLDEQKLYATLEVQTLIRQGTVNTQLGIKALGIACRSRTSVEETLINLGWKAEVENETRQNELTQLMLDSGLVNKQGIELAELQSGENNLPIGRCLVVNRQITQPRLEAILFAQSLVKDKHITTEQALAALKISFEKLQPLEHSLMSLGIRPLEESDRRVCDILSLAGLITDVGKLTALEQSLTEDIPIATILIETGMITNPVLENALALQTQILAGNISLSQAGQILKRSQAEGLSLQDLLAEIVNKGQTVNQVEQMLDLLVGTGLLTKEIISEAERTAQTTGKHLGEVILSQQEISPAYLKAAWQAQILIDDRMMRLDYACKQLRKLTETTTGSSQKAQEALQQSYDAEGAITPEPPKSWFNQIKDSFFTKKFRE